MREVTSLTATDPAGSTSEFSACVAAVVTPPEPAAVDALYVYDGDGNMVKSVIDGVATYYVGGHYEVQEDGVDTTVRKYYALGLQKVAVRTQVNSDPSTVNWLLGDHLGSTSLVANENGTLNSQIKYTAFGDIRSQSGASPTDYLYTGQRQEAELGLYYYVARWYDPAIGRFIQADTIVPNLASAMSFDRYAYAYNNPLYYTDPSGHIPELECGFSHGGCGNNTMEGYDTYQSPDILDGITSSAGYEPGYFEPVLDKYQETTIPNENVCELGISDFEPVSSYERDGYAEVWFYNYVLLNWFEIEEGFNAAYPFIKGGWKAARASLPATPLLEGLGSFGLQRYEDRDRNDLTVGQERWRGFIVGAQAAVTDIFSNLVAVPAGSAGGVAGTSIAGPPGGGVGAFVGYEAGSWTVTLGLDWVFGEINTRVFPRVGLGEYP